MISCQNTYTLHLCLVIMSDYLHFTSFSCNHMPPSGEFGGISTRNQGGAPSIDLALCMPRNSRCSRLRTPQYRRRWVVQGRCTSCESWVFRGGRPWPAPAAAGSDFRPPIHRCNRPSVGQRGASGIVNLKSLPQTVSTCTGSRRLHHQLSVPHWLWITPTLIPLWIWSQRR